MATKPLWEKDLPLDELVHRFTVGNDPQLDLQLLPYDLLGTAAHTRMLCHIGLLGEQELAQVIGGLQTIAKQHSAGTFVIETVQEDCHTAIEQTLTKLLGETGKKIHLGRSRNDQVITALRLYMRDKLFELGTLVAALAQAFASFAAEHEAVLLPGYTHLRRAMPSSIGLWAISFAEALLEQLEALQAVYQRLDRCPLGSGAGFGVPLAIDREYTASLLGFSKVQRSVADVQNSRGRSELCLANWVSEVGNVLEKYYWDLALYSTAEFGFVALPDSFTTGSSIMPQKRNPDVVELLRGRCSVLRTWRSGIENIYTGLPSNYHREYQLLKEPLFQSVRAGMEMLEVTLRIVPEVLVREEACKAACTSELFATQEAYRRVTSGEVAFRDAYCEVGKEVLAGKLNTSREVELGLHTGSLGKLEIAKLLEELDQQILWLDSTSKEVKTSCDLTIAACE